MKPHAVKSLALQALLAFAPGLYLRFLRTGRLRGNARKLLALRTDATRRDGPPRVLVIDNDFPDPTQDAGSRAIFHFVELLVEQGTQVTFWAGSRSPSAKGRARLSELDVTLVSRRRECDLSKWLGSMSGPMPFDVAVLSRPLVAATYGTEVRLLGSVRCLYYGHDIHHRRLLAMRQFVNNAVSAWELMCLARIERKIWREQDIVLYPSAEEVEYVNSYRAHIGLQPNAALLPLWSVPCLPPGGAPSPTLRRGMLFVGSYGHAPNLDGLDWFFGEVLPRARAMGCRDMVYIVGSGMERYLPPTSDTDLKVLGWLSEEALRSLYARVRIALVPLRYGGGVKGKLLEAIAHGVPCITTAAGAQGLSAAKPAIEPVRDAKQFADEIMLLTEDDDLWARKSAAGLNYLQATCSRAAVKRSIMELILGK